ncbi:MAG TPA: TetR/AcrR family transcriptional regulator [Rhizomicrobium sp.]|nr:TetR/AcrR family transcriptional regulator [Rhizomicrobium sp.]
MTTPDTRAAIMTTARLMVQARGYNALSFRDIAGAVGVKSASVHYHFPTKGDLAAALVRQYIDDVEAGLAHLLTQSKDPKALMQRYTGVFRAALENDNRMCLCGMMAAEFSDIPTGARTEVERFARVNIAWLSAVLFAKLDATAAAQKAQAILAAIQGAQLLARGRGDIEVFDQAVAAYRLAGLFP